MTKVTMLIKSTLLLAALLPIAALGQTCGDHFAPPAVVHGKKFFSSYSGEYLAIKGISYYPRPNEGELTVTNSIDFFTEEFRHIWERDIEHFKDLGVNAVRIYAVDPSKNHDAFMCALREAGIYAIIGLAADCENCAITFDEPPACYPPELKQRGEYIIQQFAKYENVLAFSAGNEVSLSPEEGLHSTQNAPCQKRFLRDMKKYIRRCSSSVRKIPIGVIKADISRAEKARYYNCRSDPDDESESADFIGLSSYLHCDGAATSIEEMAGYTKLLEDYESFDLTVPVIVTEFGCLHNSFEEINGHEAQRNFLQVEALYSKEFREHFSGGFVFEYSTEKALAQDTSPYPFNIFGPDNFGVGYFRPENCDDTTIACEYERFPQFDTLAERCASVDTSDEVNLVFYERMWEEPPPLVCPSKFPALSDFEWPSDSVALMECPVEVPVFCAGIPAECNQVTLPPVAVSSAPSRTYYTPLILSGFSLFAVPFSVL